MDQKPTARLEISDPANWEDEAREFAANLIAQGERPWFEVRWPTPEYLTDPAAIAEWEAAQEHSFDVLELVDGEFGTAPTYSEMESWA